MKTLITALLALIFLCSSCEKEALNEISGSAEAGVANREGQKVLVANVLPNGMVVYHQTVPERAALCRTFCGPNKTVQYPAVDFTQDGTAFLTATVSENGNPAVGAFSLKLIREPGGRLYASRLWKQCKGNPCTSCSFNDDKTDCNCGDDGTCDFSEGPDDGFFFQ